MYASDLDLSTPGVLKADASAVNGRFGVQGTEAAAREPAFSSISIVLPAFDEEENIERAVSDARSAFAPHFEDIEIIVVNDGSSDQTREVVDALAANAKDVVPIHHESNRGYGAALRSGIYRAGHALIFFTDSDLQFDLTEIHRLLNWIDSHEIVAGYRKRRADAAIRQLNAWCWNRLVRLIFGVKVRDIDCAFKLFRREVFDRIRIESVGAMVNTEILILAQGLKMRVKEVPVSHFPRPHGEQSGANLGVIIKAFRELWRMFWAVRRNAGLSANTSPLRRDARRVTTA